VLPPELDPRGYRPPPPGDRWKRILAWLAGSLAIIIVVVSTAGYVLYRYYNGRIGHVQIVLSHPGKSAANGSQNYLLAGIDSGRQGTGANDETALHSDTTIIAHLDKDGTTTLLSIPRDTLVTIPSYKDKSGNEHPEHKAKFNEAIQDGGPSLLVDTVQQVTGIGIDHYIQIDMLGFQRMASAVGGVNVCLARSSNAEYNWDPINQRSRASTNLDDWISQFHGQVGNNHLTGLNALAFVRQRHGLPNGDIDRIKRQQVFLGALLRQATKSSTLLNPAKIVSLANSLSGSLTLSDGTSITDLAKLGGRLHGLDPAKVHFETLPTHAPTPADGGQFISNLWQVPPYGAVQILDKDKMATMLAPLTGNQPPSTASPKPSTTSKPLTVPPSDISVTVENGTHRSGLAASTAAQLHQQGFVVGPPADADRHDITTTVVQYASGQEEQARTLAAATGAQMRLDNSVGASLVLVLGSDFVKVTPVHLGSSGSTGGSSTGSGGTTTAPSTTPSTSSNPQPSSNAATAGTCANPIY
jgi:LCP family protein required for cell wall assembly